MRAIVKRHKLSGERGGIGVVFAVIMGSGVLMGLLALAFDTGILYQEQQSLRVSSSAAARGLAAKCALGAPQCANQSAATSFVQQLLNENSRDGLSAIDELCGVAPLVSCVPLTSRSQDCAAITPGANFVRVTAKTSTPTGNTISSTFSQLLGGLGQPQYNTQLWNCAQAIWTSGGGSTTDATAFNILFPACAYPGSDAPVVIWKFRNQTNNPFPPREISCSFATGSGTVNFSNVANGFAPFFANVGACNLPLTLTVGDTVSFDDSNLRFYCGGGNSSFQDFVNPKIANSQSIRVALGGTFVKVQANKWDIDVLSFADFQFLGYRLANNLTGGAVPPGGWAAYPPGAGQNDRCTSSRDCFYGKYTSPPDFLQQSISVKLVP